MSMSRLKSRSIILSKEKELIHTLYNMLISMLKRLSITDKTEEQILCDKHWIQISLSRIFTNERQTISASWENSSELDNVS